jgi:hypothetical protein
MQLRKLPSKAYESNFGKFAKRMRKYLTDSG